MLTRRTRNHAVRSDDLIPDFVAILESYQDELRAADVTEAVLMLTASTDEVADTFCQLGVTIFTQATIQDADPADYASDVGVLDDNDPAASFTALADCLRGWLENRFMVVENPHGVTSDQAQKTISFTLQLP